jgi:hypothetical protein
VNSFLIQRHNERVALEHAFAGVEEITKD